MKRLTFSLPMVRALYAGLKTETRRTSPPAFSVGEIVAVAEPCRITYGPPTMMEVICGERGDRLHLRYRADDKVIANCDPVEIARMRDMPTVQRCRWRSGRFMPGWAERTRLRILAIEEQRLGDITEADARAEGFDDRAAFLVYFASIDDRVPVDRLRTLADLTLPVWAISFEVVT